MVSGDLVLDQQSSKESETGFQAQDLDLLLELLELLSGQVTQTVQCSRTAPIDSSQQMAASSSSPMTSCFC